MKKRIVKQLVAGVMTFAVVLSLAGCGGTKPEQAETKDALVVGIPKLGYGTEWLEALADGAVKCGLPRDKALQYAAQTMLGSAKLLLESGEHPGKLKDAVCSPGGSTIAGVAALEKGGLRASAVDAVECAFLRTRELGKR